MLFESFQVSSKVPHLVLNCINFPGIGNALPIILTLYCLSRHVTLLLNIKQRDLSTTISFYLISIHKEKYIFQRTHRPILNWIALWNFIVLKNKTILSIRKKIMYLLRRTYIISIKILLSLRKLTFHIQMIKR